jgi:ActR/RegA family two-component response regulator
MKHPQVIVLDADGWVAKQLRELADEGRWFVRTVRSVDAAMSLARERCASVVLVQFELADEKHARLAMIADVHRREPEVPVVALADAKVPDAERATWTAAVLDLGARYVLFPPVTKPVLEDVVSGLMTATVRRVVGEDAVFAPLPKRSADVIDLADEEADA